jgi:hypothetical protein
VRAADFGALANDGVDDAPALARALAAVAGSGAGTVVLGTGKYLIGSEVTMPTGVSLVGEGCGRTVMQRMPRASGQMMLRLDGTGKVTVSGISFDHASAPEFYRSIGFRGAGSHDITISDDCFTDSNPLPGRGDRWAVELSALSSPSQHVTIARNRVSGKLQMTAGGGAGVIGLTISDNDIRGAKSNGIGVTHLAPNAVFEDVLIARNRIVKPDSIGIFLGPDQPSARGGTFRRVSVLNNRVEGISARYGYGIYVRAAERESSDFTIAGNILDGAGSEENTAIRLEDDHGGGRRSFTNVHICRNVGRNFERGIWLLAVRGATLQGNDMAVARPLIAPADQTSNVRTEAAAELTGGSC